MNSYFTSTADVLESIRYAEPRRFDPSEEDEREARWRSVWHGRNVVWALKRWHTVLVEAEKILFMEGNQWNFDHAASILQFIKDGQPSIEGDDGTQPLRLPAARIHRITAADVKVSQKFEREGLLDEQMGMTRPWERHDIGSYDGQLIDGNHRAAAAILAGEHWIPVYVAENTMAEVRKKDWL